MPNKKPPSLAERMEKAPYRKSILRGPNCRICRIPAKARNPLEAEMLKPDTYKNWVAHEYLLENNIEGITDSMLNHHRRNCLRVRV